MPVGAKDGGSWLSVSRWLFSPRARRICVSVSRSSFEMSDIDWWCSYLEMAIWGCKLRIGAGLLYREVQMLLRRAKSICQVAKSDPRLSDSKSGLPDFGGNHTDAVERRAIDQLRADHGIDQYILLRIHSPVNLE